MAISIKCESKGSNFFFFGFGTRSLKDDLKNLMRMREREREGVPFGGVEAQAEKGESELDYPLGAGCGCCCDRHDGVKGEDGKREERFGV